ncbi:MAG TPA: hypothetical protein VIG29_21870 [Vicinamibacteria bacterium]
MADAIPRARWSEAELQRERYFYWQYLVNNWLVPGDAVLREPGEAPALDGWSGPSQESLLENGWLMEPATICEQ